MFIYTKIKADYFKLILNALRIYYTGILNNLLHYTYKFCYLILNNKAILIINIIDILFFFV